VEWLGIPWWVWIFVIPELVLAGIWLVVVLPAAGIAALVERARGRG